MVGKRGMSLVGGRGRWGRGREGGRGRWGEGGREVENSEDNLERKNCTPIS